MQQLITAKNSKKYLSCPVHTVILYCVALVCVKPFLPFCKQQSQCLKVKQIHVQMNSPPTNCTWQRNQVTLPQHLWDNNLKRQQKPRLIQNIPLLSRSSANPIFALLFPYFFN